MKRWHCLSVTVPYAAQEVAAAVSNFLLELGATGIVEGDHDPAQPLPQITTLQAYFPDETSGPDIYAALERYLSELSELFPSLNVHSPDTLQLSEVGSDTWQGQWRGHFPPLEVGSCFLILPPWEQRPVHTDRHVIVINPSMAFGTGHHATTQGCLEALELLNVLYGSPQRALDVGTGSGILTIALAFLGCPEIWATDADPIALAETRQNLAAHHITSEVHLSGKPIESLSLPFPLIVANLFAHTLIELASSLTQATAHHGHLILSGIQVEQAADVEAAFSAPLWREHSRLGDAEWVTLVLQRL